MDNVKNLRRYILRYTVEHSLTLLITSHFVNGVRLCAALYGLQRTNFRQDCRNELE